MSCRHPLRCPRSATSRQRGVVGDRLVNEGKIRAAGVSNFDRGWLRRSSTAERGVLSRTIGMFLFGSAG